jgi:ABC-type branched-subunit amino acid transport system substrate-binding protein
MVSQGRAASSPAGSGQKEAGMRERRHWGVASVLVVAILFAACSSTAKTSSSTTTGGVFQASTALGVGVTPTTVKIGISLVDFTCIKQFVNSIRVNQDQVYQAFINDVNARGGIDGRHIVTVYHSFCPIGSSAAVSLCTKFTEDDKVFAVLGNFVDFSGDAQTCLAKQHNTVLMTFQLTQAIMNQSPPGLIILPGTNPERQDSVVLSLMQKQHLLDGKKVAVLGEIDSQNVIKNSLEPELKKLGVQTGTTAILSISGSDTTAAQGQLDAFIERWKTENVSAIFVSGTQVASQQFIEKLRADMPTVTLISDISDVLRYGQQEQHAGLKPNPYEGIYIAGGPTAHEYDQSANWKYCSAVYLKETGKVAPNGETVVPGPDGKTLDTYGSINDACQLVTMFHDIAVRVGKYLNVPNWVHTVDTYGPIRNLGSGQYASLHAGKYDVDDTFRLEAYDSSIPPEGNWRPLTPLQDISGS